MKKTIMIGDVEVTLSNSIAWALEYRDQFNEDPIQKHIPLVATIAESIAAVLAEADGDGNISVTSVSQALQGRVFDLLIPLMQTEFLDTLINVTWAMAKAADDTIPPPNKWIRQFDEFPLDVVVPSVYEMLLKGFVSTKNLKRLSQVKDNLAEAQPKVKIQI